MPFDPNWPPTNAEIESAPFRNQFNSLKAEVDQCPTQSDMDATIMQRIIANSSGTCDDVDLLQLTVSDPPAQADVQSIADKLDDLLKHLQR
jgi:hypothetical protein